MPVKTSINVSGTWKDVSMVNVNVGGTWKDCVSVHVNVSGTWKQVFYPPIPSGMIFPYNSATPPTGFSRFTSSDNKSIIGAGSTYSNGSTGGTTSVTGISGSTDNATLANGSTFISYYGGGGGSYDSGYVTASAHSHTYTSGTATFDPQWFNVVLMKADSDLTSLPANMRVLDISGSMTDIYGTALTAADNQGKLMRIASTHGGSGGSDTVTTSSISTTSSNGSHQHATILNRRMNNNNDEFDETRLGYNSAASGNHSHTSVTLTSTGANSAIARINMAAWTNTSSSFLPGIGAIGLFESSTPPTGWELITEPSDRFVVLTHTSVGTTSSAVDMTLTGTTNSAGTHTHGSTSTVTIGQGSSNLASSTGHTSSAGAVAHNVSHNLGARLPPYYGLYYMRFVGIGE